MLKRVLHSDAPAAALLIQVMVGAVFFSEGVQKFADPAARGAGRFAAIGIPAPEIMGPFVGLVEILGGMLILLGLFIRPAAFVLLVNISMAIITTKIPILLGHEFWGFALRELKSYGFWSMAHEGRTDFCMWLGCLFLIIMGAGTFSFDRAVENRFGNLWRTRARRSRPMALNLP